MTELITDPRLDQAMAYLHEKANDDPDHTGGLVCGGKTDDEQDYLMLYCEVERCGCGDPSCNTFVAVSRLLQATMKPHQVAHFLDTFLFVHNAAVRFGDQQPSRLDALFARFADELRVMRETPVPVPPLERN